MLKENCNPNNQPTVIPQEKDIAGEGRGSWGASPCILPPWVPHLGSLPPGAGPGAEERWSQGWQLPQTPFVSQAPTQGLPRAFSGPRCGAAAGPCPDPMSKAIRCHFKRHVPAVGELCCISSWLTGLCAGTLYRDEPKQQNPRTSCLLTACSPKQPISLPKCATDDPSTSASPLSSRLRPLRSPGREREQRPQRGDRPREQQPRSTQRRQNCRQVGPAFRLSLAPRTGQEGTKGWHKSPFRAGRPTGQSPYT